MSENKKIVYVKYFADDMLQGCALLTGMAELVYRRICDHIYTSENKLIDDETTWKDLIFKFEKIVGELNKTDETRFYPNTKEGIKIIKKELLQKNKIFIEDGFIRNKGCDKWLLEAKTNFEINSERGKRGAEARWNKKNAPSNAQAIATINHKPLTISYNKKDIYTSNFNKFWDAIVNKLSKGDGAKHFSRLDEEWQNQPEKLAQLYNNYYLAQDDKKFAKQPAYWLSARKYEDQKYEPKAYSREDEIKDKARMFIDAIKENKITDFTKIWAKKNKGDVDNALQLGLIKQEDYNLLMHD